MYGGKIRLVKASPFPVCVSPSVVHPGCTYRDRPGADRDLAGAPLAVTDDEGMPLVVTLLSVCLEVRSDLGFQSPHKHPARTLAGNLVEQGSPVHPFHHRLVAGDPQHGWRLFPLVRQTEAVGQPGR
jgi:hypothetical protein